MHRIVKLSKNQIFFFFFFKNYRLSIMQSVLVRLTDVCMGEAANGSQDIQMPVSTQKPVSSHTDPKPNKEGKQCG